MHYLTYPAVKIALLVWAALVPLSWLADRAAFLGAHQPPVGPWLLLVLMVGPLLFSAAFCMAVLRLPARAS